MYLTYANSSLPSYKSLQHWSSVIMEKMNLILELQNRHCTMTPRQTIMKQNKSNQEHFLA